MDKHLPQARKEELLVHDLDDETLVYDLKRHRAHSLNRSAALVWRHCDGRTTLDGMAELLKRQLSLPRDERIVHLSPDRAREFIRTLWAALPDAARPADPLPAGKRRGKLLISCRSHYFRDVWSQNSMLVGEEREGMDRNRFPAFCLVPFSEGQIRGYLASLLGDLQRANATFELIASITWATTLSVRSSVAPSGRMTAAM